MRGNPKTSTSYLMRAKRAHKHNMSTVTSTSFNKLVRVDWSFVVTSAASSSPSPSLRTKDFDEETTANDDIRSRVNLRLVFEDDEEEEEQRRERKQREIKMELTLPQFYEFKRDLEIARKSLADDAEEEV